MSSAAARLGIVFVLKSESEKSRKVVFFCSLPFPRAGLLRGCSYLVLSSMCGAVCGGPGEAAIPSLPSHSAHCPRLALQASEPGTGDGVLPADDRIHGLCSATQAPSLHGPGCWRKLLLRCFEYGNPNVFF